MTMFMNEWEIDESVIRYQRHPVLGKATRFLADYRDEVNRKSDGWPYWGSKAAARLMDLIHKARDHEPTEAEIRRAVGPVRSFCTKKGLTCPAWSA